MTDQLYTMPSDDGAFDWSKPIARAVPRSMADESALFGSLLILNLWREAGSPKNVNLQTALMALHTAARSANAAISARAAAELVRLANAH